MEKCYTDCMNVARFINNVHGNWRNSMYVTCSVCKYKQEACCNDLLVSFDKEGKPLLITVTDANYIFGTIIDKSECLLELSNVKFRCIFENFLDQYTHEVTGDCPFLKVVKLAKAGK